jgi:hypothetical protein
MARLPALAATLLCVTRPVAAQFENCATANTYDSANSEGTCDGLIASGMPCAGNFDFGSAYAG